MATVDRFAQPSEADARLLRKTTSLIDAFRAVDPAMPLGYAAAFLAVASEPGQGVTHYADTLGMLRPVCSRVLLEIGIKTRTGGPGYELVDRVHNDADMRNVNYFLTAKGKKLLASILKHMEG